MGIALAADKVEAQRALLRALPFRVAENHRRAVQASVAKALGVTVLKKRECVPRMIGDLVRCNGRLEYASETLGEVLPPSQKPCGVRQVAIPKCAFNGEQVHAALRYRRVDLSAQVEHIAPCRIQRTKHGEDPKPLVECVALLRAHRFLHDIRAMRVDHATKERHRCLETHHACPSK